MGAKNVIYLQKCVCIITCLNFSHLHKVPRNKPNQGGKRPILRKTTHHGEKNEGRHKQMETYTMFMDWKN